MTEKKEMMASIAKYKVGGEDSSGYKIVQILAFGNEYVIYEIDDEDINNKLRVFIDGYTDESEKKIVDRFVKVKQKYIEAKGLLYRSSNFGMMKNRVAHALASVLSSSEVDGNTEFDTLIKTINDERKLTIKSRILYVLPAFIATLVVTLLALLSMEWKKENSEYWQFVCVLFGSIYGGTLSILFGLKTHRFEEIISTAYFFVLGTERVFLACVAGVIAFVLLKSKMIFQEIDVTNYWGLILIIVMAGFSEAFVPSILDKITKKQA